MTGEPSLRANLAAPFKEQVAFFRNKLGNLIPTARWDDVWKSGHDRGFMVAGAMKADLLGDFASAVDTAISQGKSIEWFRKNFDNIVDKHGWAYKGERNWRTRVIYQTNISTSYAGGRLAQLKEGGYPLWMYRHSVAVSHPRPHHVALDGVVRPADDPFWNIHYPPNGWGCKCRVVGVRSDESARLLGGDPEKKLPSWVHEIDTKTGEPMGVDKGWGYMPGASVVDEVRQMAAKTVQWEYTLAKAYMQGVPVSVRDILAASYRDLPEVGEDIRRYAARITTGRTHLDIPQYKTLGLLTSKDAETVKKIIGLEAGGYDFALDRYAPAHIHRHHGDDALERKRGQRGVVPGDYAKLPHLLNAPDNVIGAGATRKTGQPAIKIEKRFDAEEFVSVWEIRKGRKMMALQSLWIVPEK